MPPYRDYVILVIFHGGISRKIITELLGFELHGARRSAPRCVERSIKRNAAPLGKPRKAGRWSSKELSLSQGAIALKEHELLAAVVVKSAKKHVLIVSSDSSPRGHEFVLPAAERAQDTRDGGQGYPLSDYLPLRPFC